MPNLDLTRIAGNIDTLNALNSLQTINKNLAICQVPREIGDHLAEEASEGPLGVNISCTFDVQFQGLREVLNLPRTIAQCANSRIKNAKKAKEQVEDSKTMILQQTSIALRAQANMTPQFLLSLFS